jgi:hypothetical protein
MEEEFNNLNIDLGGITWDQFKDARERDIDDLLDHCIIHGPPRVLLVLLWARHNNREREGIYHILNLYICFFNYIRFY